MLHIGTFQVDVKYVIAFALLCSFQDEKLFPKADGVWGKRQLPFAGEVAILKTNQELRRQKYVYLQ